MRTLRITIPVLLISTLFLFACSDDDPVSSGGSTAPPSPVLKVVECPTGMAASANSYAQSGENYLTYIGALTAFESYITLANATITTTGTTPDTTYANWSVDSLDYEMRYCVDNGYYYWQVFLDGYDGSSLYSDQIFIRSSFEPAADSVGNFYAYPDPTDTNQVLHWHWTTKDSVYTITYDNGTANSYRAVLNPNGSGSVTYRVYDVNNILVTWDSIGYSGTWTNYLTPQSGTWSAPIK